MSNFANNSSGGTLLREFSSFPPLNCSINVPFNEVNLPPKVSLKPVLKTHFFKNKNNNLHFSSQTMLYVQREEYLHQLYVNYDTAILE